MKTNVKKGDLAFIVGATVCPENNGKIVEVVRPFPVGQQWGNAVVTGENPSWFVRTKGSPLLCIFTDRLTGTIRKELRQERPYSDRCLRPIRPQPDDAVDEMVKLVGKPSGLVTTI